MALRHMNKAGVSAILLRALCASTLACTAILVGACDEVGAADPKKQKEPLKDTKVTIGGKSFTLELALDDKTRFQGLSGRTEIKPDEGMLFIFPRAEERYFVMRDCPVDIDIIFLDGVMKITAMHEMKPEDPRKDDEKQLESAPGIPEWARTNRKYEERLKRYYSKFASQYVIELKGGTLKGLGLKEGQKIELDPALKKWVR